MGRLFIIGFASLILFSACDPDKWLSSHSALWYVKNSTDISLKISHSRMRTEHQIIEPGDSVCIFTSGRCLGDNEFPPFDDILALDKISVYDKDGNVLQEWHQESSTTDEYSIFKEKEWRHYKEHISGPEYAFIWVYNIHNAEP